MFPELWKRSYMLPSSYLARGSNTSNGHRVTVGIHIMYIVLHPIGEFFNHVPAAVKCHKFYANAYRDTEPPFKVIFERCMTFIFDAPHLENYLC